MSAENGIIVLKQADGKDITLSSNDIYGAAKFKLYFDTIENKPIANEYGIVVAGLEEELPAFVNRPEGIDEREVVLVILKKEGE